MTETGQTDAQPGQKNSLRSMIWLYLASMICPAIVWANKGHFLRAALTTFGLVGLWVCYACFWLSLKFNPVWPTIWFGFMWSLLLFLNAHDAAVAPIRGEGRFARGATTAFLSTISWFGPLLVLAAVFFTHGASLVKIYSASMFPTVLPGDLVWVDRQIYRLRWPEPSDVVVYKSLESNQIRIGRVVGFPGDVIEFRDGEWHFSRYEVLHGDIRAEQAQRFQDVTGVQPDFVGAQFEGLGDDGAVYTIAGTASRDEERRFDGEGWQVGEGELFVLNDNRGHVDDSRFFGPIRYEQLIGMPLYILNNTQFRGKVSRMRAGVLIQKPRFVHEKESYSRD